jgi:hypothetical protein
MYSSDSTNEYLHFIRDFICSTFFNHYENYFLFEHHEDWLETRTTLYFYLLGSIVKSIHGPSVILTELMNNFELISHATTALKNPSFHPKTALLINQIL